MRIVLLTSSNPFRLALCQAILDAGEQLIAVVEPMRGLSNGFHWRQRVADFVKHAAPALFGRLRADPLYGFLRTHRVSCVQWPDAKSPDFASALADLKPDLVVLSRFGRILPAELLSIPPRGVVNVHCSLLPQLRGRDPIPGAIIGGLTESGVTMHFADPGVDTGDVIAQRPISLATLETYRGFCRKAATLMYSMMLDVLRTLRRGKVENTPQDPSQASYCNIGRFFGTGECSAYLDWSQPASILETFVRAGVCCLFTFRGRSFQVLSVRIRRDPAGARAAPGEVLARCECTILVGTGDDPVEVQAVPRAAVHWWPVANDLQTGPSFRRSRLELPAPGFCFPANPWPDLADILSVGRPSPASASALPRAAGCR